MQANFTLIKEKTQSDLSKVTKDSHEIFFRSLEKN